MNKMMRLSRNLIALLLLFSGPPLWASESGNQPSPPYVNPVPERCEWSMKILSASSSAPADKTSPEGSPAQAEAGVIKEIRYSKVEDIQRVILLTTDGKSQEFYSYKNYYLVPTTFSGRVVVMPFVPTSPPYPYFSQGFYGVDWIKPEFFSEIMERGKSKCFHYKGTKANPLASLPNLPAEIQEQAKLPIVSEAWIDSKTLLPVAVVMEGQVFEFSFGTPPEHIELPSLYKEAWKAHEDQIARLEALKVK
jgi:hypothetical protein